MRKNGLLFSLVLVLGLIFTSCEVGLGAAVDVKTPELSIKYPTTGSTIRKAFALSGTWDDDGKIESIKVAIKPTEEGGNQKSHEYDATFDVLTKTWICVIDPLSEKDPIIDGSYEATITINDTAKHSNSKSRQFTIDNTPPVLALTRPSTIAPDEKTSTDYDSYGQDFIVSGHVGDACDSKYMSVSIYDLNNNLLYTKEKTKIDSDFSVTVASYSGEDDLKDAYEKIYGKDLEAGTKAYLCSITSYDAAESFPTDGSEQKDEDLKGNEVTYFYMYEGDLYNDVFYPYGTQNAYKILSNVFGSSEARSVSANIPAEEAKAKLQDENNQVKLGFFSLNPQNNPSYLVSGKDPLKKDGTDFIDNTNYEISNGSKIVVEVAPGLDATPLNADTLGLYLIECDENGKPLPNAKNIDILPRITDDDGKVLLDDPNAIADRKSYISKSGSTYKLMAEINMGNHSELAVEHTYVIGVYGSDTKKIPVKNLADTYGFLFTTTGSAPELVLDSPKGSMTYWKKGSSVVVSGYTKANNSAPLLKIILEYTDKNGKPQTETVKEYNSAADYDSVKDAGSGNSGVKKLATFSYEIPADKFDQNESRQYTLSVVSSLGGFDAEVSKTILYDDDLPEITIFEPTTPQADKYDADFNVMGVDADGNVVTKTKANENDITTGIFINGKTSFRISLSDKFNSIDKENNISKVEFFQDDVVKYTFDNITSPANQEIVIDTETALVDKKPVTIKVTTYDLAGNKATKTIERFVDQSTDKPVIMPVPNTSTTLKYTSMAELEAAMANGSNDNIFVSGGQLQLQIVDDDGIEKIERFMVNGTDETTAKSNITTAMNAAAADDNYNPNDGSYDVVRPGNNTSSTISVAFTNYENHWLKFRVTDKYGEVTTTSLIPVVVTSSSPVVSAKLKNKYITQNTTNVENPIDTFETELTIDSTQTPFKVYRQVVEFGEDLDDKTPDKTGHKWTEIKPGLTEKTFTDNYKPTKTYTGSTNLTVYYLVQDRNNHFSAPTTIDGQYCIDNDYPDLSFKTVEWNGKSDYIITPDDCKQSSYTFEGTAGGDNETSGVKSVELEIKIDDTYKQTMTATGTTNWVARVKFEEFDGVFFDKTTSKVKEGPKTATLKVIDNAGNYSILEKTFVYDVSDPVLTVNSVPSFMNSSGYTITGTATDSYKFGKLIIKEKLNGTYTSDQGTEITSVTNKSTTGGAFSIKVPLNSVIPTGTGKYEYIFELYDSEGKEASNTSPYVITVDVTKPTTTVNSNATNGMVKTSGITYSGIIEETNFDSAEVVLCKKSGSSWSETETKTTIKEKNWSWNVSNLADGTYGIKIKIYDKAENTNEGYDNVQKEVTVDTVLPKTTITGINITDSSGNAVSTITNGDSIPAGTTYYSNVAYTISGTITDTNFDKAIYTIDNGDSKDLTVTNNTWSITGTGGNHTYNITLSDKAGNTNSYSFTVRYDDAAPIVTITTPASDIEDPNLAINTEEYSFRINANDGEGVGVAEIKYGFSSSNTTQPTSWTEDKNFADGDKYFTMPVKEGTEVENGKLSEGVWYLWAKAKDKSGKESDAAIRKIIVDKSNPTLTVSQTLSESGTNAVYSEVTNDGLKLSGTVSDTNALDNTAAVVIKVDGNTKSTFTKEAVASGWSYTIQKGTDNGTLKSDSVTEVEIIAKDTVGKTTTKKYTIYYDTKAPELEIASPTADEPVETSSKVIKGTVSDEGYGLAKVEFALKDVSGTIVKDTNGKQISGSTEGGNYKLTIKGEQWFVADNSGKATAIPLGSAEGALKLYVKATENANGSRNTEKTVDFYYDTADPSIEETGIGTTGKTTNTNYTFSGTAYDTNQLSKIEIKEGTTVIASTSPVNGQVKITCDNLTTAKTEATKANWSTTITATSVSDGTHSYTVVATDISGKEKQLTRVVTMDKTAPSITENIVNTTGTSVSSKTWYGTKSIPVSIKASDGTGSGVTSVEYAIGSSADTADWKALANTGSAFEGNIQFAADGKQTYYVRAKDVAGNYTAVANRSSNTVYIDSTKPNEPVLSKVDGQTLSGQKLTNKAAAITFTFTASDNTTAGAVGTGSTGINTAKLVKIGSTELDSNAISATSSGSTYSITIPSDKIENGSVTVSVEDKVGNTTETTLFQITVDNEYPSTSINAIVDADSSTTGTQVNKILTISGTANDNNTLSSVKLQYMIKGETNWPTTWADYSATNKGNNYNWSFEVDTTKSPFTDGDNVRFRAVATDTAGNIGNSGKTTPAYDTTNPKEVIISQDSDRPIIKINNLKLESPSEGYYWLKEASLYGDVTDDDGTVTAVKWSTDGNSWSNNIYNNGLWTIPSFTSDGNKTVYFQVVDANGTTFNSNAASTTLATFGPKIKDSSNTEKLGYSTTASDILNIKVDTKDPVISEKKFYKSSSDTIATNPDWLTDYTKLSAEYTGGTNKYIYYQFAASDVNGLESVEIKFANETASTNNDKIKILSSTSPYRVRIDTTKFTSGTSNLNITVKDKAGRSVSETQAIMLDVTAPTATLDNFIDADSSTDDIEVNGKIDISGTANDNIELASVVVQYKKSEGSADWTDTPAITENMTNWTAEDIDTALATAFTDETKYTVRVKATDKVGNVGYSAEKTVKVSQKTDYPKIRITNLSLKDDSTTPWLLNVNTLYGIITDDDGNVESLEYKIGTTGEFTELTSAKTSGSFEISNIPDGDNTIYFKVKDAEETVFNDSNIVITDGTTTWGESNLSLKVDKTLPSVTEIKYSYYDSESTEEEDDNKWSEFNSSVPTVGHDRTKLKVQFKASDANAIKTVSGTFNGGTITFTCSDEDYDDASAHIWTSSEITIPTTESNEVQNKTLAITVEDTAGLKSTPESTIPIDNAKPNFTFTSPSDDNSVVYGVVTNTVGGNSTSSDIAKRQFAVTETEDYTEANWEDITDKGNTTVTLIFDGTTGTTDGFHTKTLREYIEDVYDRDSVEQDEKDDNEDLYIHVKITDNCGNYKVESRKINVIPNGDKPTVSIDYPEKDGGSLAGSIRLNGQASAYIGGIKAVYVQIDTNYTAEDGKTPEECFTSDWETGFDSCIDDLEEGESPYKDSELIGKSKKEKGIPANGTQNWNLTINSKKEFNPEDSNGVRSMAIKVYSVSNSNKLSDPVIRVFKIDPNAPRFGGTDEGRNPLELIQKDGSGTITARVPYESEMWVKGNWYLVGSVSDDGGIKELTLDTNNGTQVQTVIKNGAINVSDYASVNNEIPGGSVTYKNWDMCIPLATGTSSGQLKYTLVATEGGGTDGSMKQDIIVNFDNTPPSLALDTHNQYSILPKVQQSNGFYTLKSFASDNDSGISRVAFYFLRRTDSETKIYDPMINNTSVSLSDTEIVYSDGLYWLEKTASVSGSTITLNAKDENIHPGSLVQISGSLYKISKISEDGQTITLTTSAPDDTKAKFALALVVDNMDKKESAAGDIQTDEGYGEGYYDAPQNDDGDRMVEVWDGTSSSGQWQAQINSANIPDGPIEIHYVAFDKSLNYSVGIVGNVEYDTYKDYETADVTESKTLENKNSDNSTSKLASHFVYSYGGSGKEAYVSNNGPRIVGVTFGCDYSGNGEIEDTEKTTRYYSTASRTIEDKNEKRPDNHTDMWISSVNDTKDGDAWAVVKDMSSVELEIVGGNGDLFYEWQIDDSYAKIDGKSHLKTAKNTEKFDTINENTNIARQTLKDDNKLEYYTPKPLKPIYLGRKEKTGGGYELDTSLFGEGNGKLPDCDKSNSNAKWWTIKVWDSTYNTTEFVDSQYAMLVLPISIQVQDKIAPNTVFNDLYWKSSTDNSVYMNPTTEKLEGHIELKDYLLGSGFTNDNYGTDDDKISGKVVFSGYAYDNKRLGRLSFGISNSKGKVGANTNDEMNKNNTNQAWPQTLGTPYVIFDGTSWTTAGLTDDDLATAAENGTAWGQPYCQFKVYTDEEHGAYLNADGHKVYWELIIDTSYIQQPGQTANSNRWGLGKDLYVWVRATDGSSNNTSMTATDNITEDDATSIRPNYKVDVVPYITGVSSRLGTKADDNRSSSGRYQIAENETGIQLIGYNLNEGSANYTITTPTTSGAYPCVITKGTTEFIAINNLNNNDAVGSTPAADQSKVKNKYNMQPSTYNQTLTDDVAFDIWQINNKGVNTNTGISFIQQPVMRYNPVTGNLGFAFSNGANKFSMPNGKSNSYELWEGNYAAYVSNAMVFDSTGRAHGISVGIDTEPNSYKAGRMNLFDSKWGPSATDSTGNFNDKTNSVHLDSIGRGDSNIIEQSLKSTTMAVAGNNRIYVAYYDLFTDAIRFRYGYMIDTMHKDNTNGYFQQSNEENYQTSDSLGQLRATNTDGEDGWNVPEQYYSVLAGGSTGLKAAEYVDITVIDGGNTAANDVVCAVWYDGRQLKYSYKKNPCNDNDYSTTHTDGYWSEAQTLISNGGQYCKIEADANGGIHIAAFDQAARGVVYIYLPTYSTTFDSTKHYYVIDASNGPYDEIGLDVAVSAKSNTGKAYPTISYYANGIPKMARYIAGITKASGTTPDMPTQSWVNNTFTGNWDVCFIPTDSNLLKDHVCVALPKNATGVSAAVTNNTDGQKTGSFDEDNINDTGKTNGTVAGNGTTNAIIGYAIRDGAVGYFEIAQRK